MANEGDLLNFDFKLLEKFLGEAVDWPTIKLPLIGIP